MKGNGYDADLMGKVFNGKDNGSLAHQTNAIKMIKVKKLIHNSFLMYYIYT